MPPAGVPRVIGPGHVPGFTGHPGNAATSGIQFVRQLASNAVSISSTTITLVPTTNAAAGDMLVLAAVPGSTQAVSSVTDTKGNTWLLAADPGVNGSRCSLYYTLQDFAPLTTSDTITVTFASTATDKVALCLEFSGVRGVSPLDATGTNASTTSTAMTATTGGAITNGYELVIGAFGWQAAATRTCTAGVPANGYEQDQSGGSFLSVFIEYQILWNAQLVTQTQTGTLSGAPINATQVIATFLPASVAVKTTPPIIVKPPASQSRAPRATHVYVSRPIVVPAVAPTVTPTRPIIITAPAHKLSRRAQTTSNRWPGYQWVGLPPVLRPVPPQLLKAPTPRQDRHTNIITNRWPGYQWVGLPPVAPLIEPRVVLAAPRPDRARRAAHIYVGTSVPVVVPPAQPKVVLAATRSDRRRATHIYVSRPIVVPVAAATPPLIQPIIVKAPSPRQDRHTTTIANRWPGYQWVGLPAVLRPVPPTVILVRHPKQDRKTSITQNRWGGYQWVGLPPVLPPIPARILRAPAPRQDRRTSITTTRWPGYQWSAFPPVPPPRQPQVRLVASPRQDRHTSVTMNRWPGYQWVGLPPVTPHPNPIVVLSPSPRQDRRPRIVFLRPQPLGVTNPTRTIIVFASKHQQPLRGGKIIAPRPVFAITPPVVTPLKTVYTLYASTPTRYRRGSVIFVRGINTTGAPPPPPPVVVIPPDVPGGTVWVEVGGYNNPHRPDGWKTRRGW